MTRQILVVDDDDSILTIVKLSLEFCEGWVVSTIDSATEAIALAESECPDAIVLDVMMPELNGAEVLQALRSKPATQDIPIIFLTAKADRKQHQSLKDLGAAGVLVKPFEPDMIADQIKTLLHWSD
ncbi:hypothetical protein S7335_706 [Synechococcus sp. PCC 7335]|uniref:response regulator n=1 Tax=Synechococcus sp. (strain ATCC 29403 / PCC 7335) TaxID=91464 RepID=UPI00017EC453|nr:response regulator [Synechococcus sp. PCC 7335]EDX83526.1 hypothetical protein S7335_706 [Synechococcus sp. PCC 7335]